jgi:hypothetical protein
MRDKIVWVILELNSTEPTAHFWSRTQQILLPTSGAEVNRAYCPLLEQNSTEPTAHFSSSRVSHVFIIHCSKFNFTDLRQVLTA